MTPQTAPEPERIGPGVARWLLGVAYLCLSSLFAWQASQRVSPSIFSDEIEFTQISRGIAETGMPSRLGEPSGFGSLYTYLVAPAWWLDPTSAWEAAKLIGALVMAAAIFPAYGLARFVVSRPWAIAAAIGAVAAPPLAYAPYLLEEPLAYPFATTALWAITAAVARPTRGRLALAAALCLVAPFVRGELGVLLAVFGAGLFTLLWQTEGFRRWRSTWSTGDWVGAALLVLGAVVVFSAAAGHRSDAWYVATGFEKHRLLDHAVWSVAALTIGVAVLPVVATVAAFCSGRVRATREGRAFVVVGVSACAAFVTYAAVKGAYLSTVFSLLIVERNVIYLVPVVFAAMAAVLSRPLASPVALAAGFLVALFLILSAELRLGQYPYFEAPSLSIGHLANRNFSWDETDVEHALIATALVSLALLAARSLVRSRKAGLAIAVVAACGVTAWALTAEIYAARGLNIFSERMHQISPKPVDWVDQATNGEPTLFLGQQLGKDTNPIWLLEFWNYSIDKIWSLDGTAPLPSLSPDLGDTDGTMSPDPGVSWVVTGNGVEVVGEQVGEPRNGMQLWRVDPPARFRNTQTGVFPDGWMSSTATFSQYAPEDGVSRGFAKVVVSRQGACGALPVADVTIAIGPVAVVDKQPGFARVDEVVHRKLPPCGLTQVVTRATVPYHVEVTVSPTFIPAEIDAGSGDVRELGAQVGFDFLPLGAG